LKAIFVLVVVYGIRQSPGAYVPMATTALDQFTTRSACKTLLAKKIKQIKENPEYHKKGYGTGMECVEVMITNEVAP
jgi:hypothetical protein